MSTYVYRNRGTNQVVYVEGPQFDGNALWELIEGATGGSGVSQADLVALEADTTNIHGIPDTSQLETIDGSTHRVADGIATHSSDSTAVHGIADTSLLETTAGAAAKVTAHAGAADPHGDRAWATPLLAAKVAKGELVFNVKDYGAIGDGSHDDTTNIQSAVTAASAAGGTVHFPAATKYKITDAISVTGSKVTLSGVGRGSVIEQFTWGKPIFDLQWGRADHKVTGLKLICTQTRTVISGPSSRGSGAYVYAAAIWSANDRLTVDDVWVSGFVAGVVVGNWNGTALSGQYSDNTVTNLRADTVDWAVLAFGQKRLTISGCKGSYLASQDPNPSHFIYFSDLASGDTMDDCVVTDCSTTTQAAIGTYDGHAYQFKATVGGVFANLWASNTAGLFSLNGFTKANVSNCGIRNAKATVAGDVGAGLYMQDAGSSHNMFSNINVQMGADARAHRLSGSDNTFESFHVETARATDSTAIDVYIDATRATLSNWNVASLGTGGGVAFNNVAGDDNRILNPATYKCYQLFVRTAGNRSLVSFDPSSQVSAQDHMASVLPLVQGTGNGLQITRSDNGITVVQTAGTAYRADVSRYSHIVLDVQDTTGWTMSTPVPGPGGTGIPVTFEIRNNSGGAMGAIAWAGAYKLAGAFTNPASTKRRLITFRWNGTDYAETSRSAADI